MKRRAQRAGIARLVGRAVVVLVVHRGAHQLRLDGAKQTAGRLVGDNASTVHVDGAHTLVGNSEQPVGETERRMPGGGTPAAPRQRLPCHAGEIGSPPTLLEWSPMGPCRAGVSSSFVTADGTLKE